MAYMLQKVAEREFHFTFPITIVEAEGKDHVTGVTIAEVDNHFQFIPGTEKHFDVDTICPGSWSFPNVTAVKNDRL